MTSNEKTLAYLALVDILSKASESSDVLSDVPGDKYARCTGHILDALAELGIGRGDPSRSGR